MNNPRRADAWAALLLAVASIAVAMAAMRSFRASGAQPFFYQENFQPAVMVACGYGFTMPAQQPPALREFLLLKRNEFSCAELPADLTTAPVRWNASWVYLYRTVGVFWRLFGMTWTSLDVLVSLMCGAATVGLYGIFRIVASPLVAAAMAMVLTISRANVSQLLSLRDFSKAPFVLAALFILALLSVRRFSLRTTLLLSAAYGLICGVGWGFRGDLIIMLPLGAAVAAICLHRPLGDRALAVATVATAFLIAGWPVVSSLSSSGACQFHYALLGLSTPLVGAMGTAPAPYQFSDQFLDTSIAVRVFDFATRIVGDPAFTTCTPAYETASGRLYAALAATFPADLVMHAYGSTIFTLAGGLELAAPGSLPFQALFGAIARATSALAPSGPLLLLAAIGVTAATSTRLSMALTLVSLFVAGYPAIEYEQRHWFHLRFLPWFALLIVAGARVREWRQAEWVRAAAAVTLLVVLLSSVLAAVRLVQSGRVRELIRSYQAAALEPLPLAYDGDFVRVAWPGEDRMPAPILLGSDLLAIRFNQQACAGSEPLTIRAMYAVDANWHDLSSSMTIERPVDAERAQAFVPVFRSGYDTLEYLRFTGFRVNGAPASCISGVGRVIDRAALPLWLQVQVPAAGSPTRLYHTFRVPRLLRWLPIK